MNFQTIKEDKEDLEHLGLTPEQERDVLMFGNKKMIQGWNERKERESKMPKLLPENIVNMKNTLRADKSLIAIKDIADKYLGGKV